MQLATTKILAGKLFDSESAELVSNKLITISPESGLILNVQTFEDSKEGLAELNINLQDPNTIDLRDQTVLPGFVDTHVHFFLHPYSETTWEDQVTRESLAERTIRATVHARRTLMAGYTAVRDLGTEGAEDADLALRKCISGPQPMIPGPRYFTANRAIVATGSYGPKNKLYPNRNGIEGIMGAEVADGVDECRKAVRRQIGAGADWIKVYADYRMRANIADVSPAIAAVSISTFSEDELAAMKAEAHRLGVKITAHAMEENTLSSLRRIRVDSIEHGNAMGEICGVKREVADGALRDSEPPIFWVPTLATYYTVGGASWQRAVQSFRQALKELPADIQIACGGDTGVFAHGENALEMKVMHSLGAEWRKILQWCTLNGWKCIRSMRWEQKAGSERLERVEELQEDARAVGDNEVPFGVVRTGFAADIIASSGDLEHSFREAVDQKSITFVMKGGRVYKRNGQELC